MFSVVTLAAVAFTTVGVGPAEAATITVTTTNDELNSDGDCSLREAIHAANTDTAVDACVAGSGDDTIQLPAGTYTLTIPGQGEELNATGDLDPGAHHLNLPQGEVNISGAGASSTIIDGGGLDRVIDYQDQFVSGATPSISGVTIRNGSTTPGGGDGGGIRVDEAFMTISDSIIMGNSATGLGQTGGRANGGGIFVDHQQLGAFCCVGVVTLNRSTVTGNHADGGGGGLFIFGKSVINDSTISDNSASVGGGLWGSFVINRSSIRDNTATDGAGGGMAGAWWSEFTLNDSVVSGNEAIGGGPGGGDPGASGGGIHNGGTLTVNNTTVSGNTAAALGGGIVNQGQTTLNNSTVSFNSPTGVTNYFSVLTESQSTIIANNAIANCADGPGSVYSSLGHNLSSDSTCDLTGVGDLQNTDPLLGPLANNGGPTQTHALLSGSPAMNAASPSCPPPGTDQRGIARPQGRRCDIGAFERCPTSKGVQHCARRR